MIAPYLDYIIPILTAILTWIAKSIYDKIFMIKPRLYVPTDKVLYQQRNNHYINFEYTWVCTIRIKNNSKFTAENIEIIFPENYNISDVAPENLLEKNNHLESYQGKFIETSISRTVPYEDVMHTSMEEGVRIMSFSSKMNDPQEYFKPDSLKGIKFILKYTSEKGKSFYTLYRKQEGLETNKIFTFNPLTFSWLVKLL